VLFQAAAVDPDADRDVFLAAGLCDQAHMVVVPDIARVDADLVRAGVHAGQRGAVVEMDVRHHRDVTRFLDRGDRPARPPGEGQVTRRICAPRLRRSVRACATLPATSSMGTFSIVCTAMGLFAADLHLSDPNFALDLPALRASGFFPSDPSDECAERQRRSAQLARQPAG
jgi:hypothetical protein